MSIKNKIAENSFGKYERHLNAQHSYQGNNENIQVEQLNVY
jgi:hypothetical protein